MSAITSHRGFSWAPLPVAAALACWLYRPWQARAFDVLDFSEFLPLLNVGHGVGGRLALLTHYYAGTPRTAECPELRGPRDQMDVAWLAPFALARVASRTTLRPRRVDLPAASPLGGWGIRFRAWRRIAAVFLLGRASLGTAYDGGTSRPRVRSPGRAHRYTTPSSARMGQRHRGWGLACGRHSCQGNAGVLGSGGNADRVDPGSRWPALDLAARSCGKIVSCLPRDF